MARKGSGLRTAIKIVKAIDKAGKQAAREAERRRKQEERELARQAREFEKQLRQEGRELARQEREFEKQLRQAEREYQRQLKQEERDAKAREKALIAAEKERFKTELENAKHDFECRCIARQELRKEFVDSEIR